MEQDPMNKSTRRLLRDLKYLLIHVLVYLPSNIYLVLYYFSAANTDWWPMALVVVWSGLMVYHCIYLNMRKGEKSLLELLSLVFNL